MERRVSAMPLSAGSQAPDFTLTGVDGKEYRLSQALERGLLLAVFVKTTCPACDLIMPYLKRLAQTYPHKGWQVWVISQNFAESSRRYAERFGASFPVVVDEPEQWPVSHAWDPPVTPTLFLVGADARVEAVTWGFSKGDLNQMAERIASHLGEPPHLVAQRDDGNPDARPG
jgi:peroxiredoxin